MLVNKNYNMYNIMLEGLQFTKQLSHAIKEKNSVAYQGANYNYFYIPYVVNISF